MIRNNIYFLILFSWAFNLTTKNIIRFLGVFNKFFLGGINEIRYI